MIRSRIEGTGWQGIRSGECPVERVTVHLLEEDDSGRRVQMTPTWEYSTMSNVQSTEARVAESRSGQVREDVVRVKRTYRQVGDVMYTCKGLSLDGS